GFYTFVTIDPAGSCAMPSWADTDVYAETTATKAAAKADKSKAAHCAAEGYGLIQAIKSYEGSLIAMLPENAKPNIAPKMVNGFKTYPWGMPAKNIVNQVGTLGDRDTLGKMIDECLQRLTKVQTAADCPKCQPPLSSVPIVKRLFLAGH